MSVRIIKKADLILASVLIAISVLALLSFAFAGKNRSAASEVVITKDGKIFKTCSLFENMTVDTGSNTIVIENGQVYMKYSDCKNQICVREGRISKAGQTIICMPNRIVVEIKGGDGDYDAVTR